MTRSAAFALLLALPWIAACTNGGEESGEPAADGPAAEAVSLYGVPLNPPELPPETLAERQEKLAQARVDHEQNPDDADALIWLGRRTAYLGHYREAIEIFSQGVEKFPDDPRMLRHRGHRYISTRRFDLAIEDLERAAAMIAGKPDEIEPDGLPNDRNQPTSTSHSNIWYHLGLAYYLVGDLENAARCYRECMKFSNNPDMLCATTHWLYLTLRRLGNHDEAEALLEPIDAGMDVIENRTYH
jgi:tetratricopeptide (TPR) repeat protein